MKVLSIISLIILITGCSSYAPLPLEPIETPTHFKESLKVNNTGLENHWWRNFHDEKLNELMNLALANNLNYQISLKSIEAAKEYKVKSSLNPFSRFFGKEQITEGQVAILEEKSRMIKLTVISEVADIYFKIATINATIPNLTRQYTITNSLLKIATTQHGIGYIDSTALRDVRTKQNSIKNELKNIKKQKNLYTNSLADLLGQYPEDFNIQIKAATFTEDFTKLIPATDPAQVVADRPDIQVARLQVKNSDETQYQQAELNYKATVLHAFQEVDSALLSFKDDQESYHLSKANFKNASEDYKSAEIQYNAGQIDYATYLSFELHMLQKKYALSQVNLLLYSDIIMIYKSLGMGV